ncbi:hypothetical protein B0H63DRAFT_405482, partial [Podospora didyma]
RFWLTRTAVVDFVFSILIIFISLAQVLSVTSPYRRGFGLLTWAAVLGCLGNFALGTRNWLLTLSLSKNLETVWNAQAIEVQSDIQTAFKCCGYFKLESPVFVTDQICLNTEVAGLMTGCIMDIVPIVDVRLRAIFTAHFGMVGIRFVMVMASLCWIKENKRLKSKSDEEKKVGKVGITQLSPYSKQMEAPSQSPPVNAAVIAKRRNGVIIGQGLFWMVRDPA